MSGLTENTAAGTHDKIASRKLKIQKLHEEKHATSIQAQWRGKMIRQQIANNANEQDVDEDDDELEASMAPPEAAKDMNVEQIREQAAIRTHAALLESGGDDASSWPIALVENFDSPVPNTSWPDLAGESSICWKWLMENNKIITRCITWNLCGNNPPCKEDIQKLLVPLNKFHVLVVGSEECERSIQASMLNPSKKNWEALLVDVVGEKYAPIRSHTLQAIHIMVFVHIALIPFVSEVSSAAVTTGIANTLGNKGGTGIRFRVGSTSLAFGNAHLAAHQNAVKARNANFQRIDAEMPGMLAAPEENVASGASATTTAEAKAEATSGPPAGKPATVVTGNDSKGAPPDGNRNAAASASTSADDKASGSSAPGSSAPGSSAPGATDAKKTAPVSGESPAPALIGHKLAGSADAVVFMGDLNYRIRGNRKIVDQLLAQGMHEVLYNNDQLRWSMENLMVLNGFTEPPLHFKPTYKFDVKSDVYDTGMKQRIPAWTDRILYTQRPGVKCIAYDADFALKTSDHRPVYASFVIDIQFSDEHKKLLEVLVRGVNDAGAGRGAGADAGTTAPAVPADAKVDYNSTIEFSSQSQVCTVS